jgi:alpha-1,2-mannosyltransferase
MSESKTTGVGTKGTGGGLAIVALVCGVFGLAGWAFDLWFFRGAPGQDWMVFYTAAQSYFDGNLPLIFNGETLTAAINQRFADWLILPLGPHPWVYPPPFLLLLLPFGALPPLASAASFILAGFAAAVFAVWRYVDFGIRRWPMIGTLVLCPAVPFDVLTGQNAFYTAALLVCSFGVLARRPIVSGMLLGLLSVKPQLCLMAAVALLAARQWRALGAAAASACLLALASVAVLGLDIWRAWFDLVAGGSKSYQAWIHVGRLNGISVYACASWLGAPSALANAAQAVAMLTAAGIVYWIYRQRAPEAIRLAVLLAATILAAPHASNSDAVLLGLAASIFVAAIAPESRPYQLAIAAAVWISPLFNPPVLFRIGCATPLLVAALLAVIAITIRGQHAPTPAVAAAPA